MIQPFDFRTALSARVEKAHTLHPRPYASPAEAIGIIREEYLEAEREFFRRNLDPLSLLDELLDLAAVCQRAAEEVALPLTTFTPATAHQQ